MQIDLVTVVEFSIMCSSPKYGHLTILYSVRFFWSQHGLDNVDSQL